MDEGDRLEAQVRRNAIKSVMLLAGFPFVLPLVSFFFVYLLLASFEQRNAFAAAGTVFLFVLAFVGLATLIWLPIGYVLSQSIIDDATGARLVGRHDEPRLWALMENLCRKAGMRLPALRIIETEVLNAYASGLSEGRYSVAVTRGLMNELNDDELEGVLAHELTHIRNSDCRLLVVATILVGLVPLLHEIVVRWFWMMVTFCMNLYRGVFSLIPIPMAKAMVTVSYTLMFWAAKGVAYVIGTVGHFCTLLIHFSLSRRREFMADAGAVELTGNPQAMISALRRITCNSVLDTKIEGVREMFFDNPLTGLFSTHPAVEKRIEAIIAFADLSDRELYSDEPSSRSTRDSGVSPASEALKPDGYEILLLGAMGGSLEVASLERRNAVYRRARHALRERALTTSPPLDPDEIEEIESELEDAIEQLESRATAASRATTGRQGRLADSSIEAGTPQSSTRRRAWIVGAIAVAICVVVLDVVIFFSPVRLALTQRLWGVTEAAAPAVKTEATFDISRVAALLDRSSTNRSSVGEILRERLASCWSIQIPASDYGKIRAVVELWLNRDGSLARVPVVVESSPGPLGQSAAESALRAVRRCAPYELPADQYDDWRHVRVAFDPAEMFRRR